MLAETGTATSTDAYGPAGAARPQAAAAAFSALSYSALIRTYNCESTLPHTLECLQRQTQPPAQYIFVDSGSTDRTLSLVPPGSIIHTFQGREFNYAEALNQGLAYVSTEYVLIISSHTTLSEPSAVEYALRLLSGTDEIAAAYFTGEGTGDPPDHRIISKDSFTGFNGMWNTCALIKVAMLRKRGFRPEVFSAEDQEWASWLFASEGKVTARITGCGMQVHNPRKHSRKKRLNEYISIAYFSNRSLLRPGNVLRIGLRALSLREPQMSLQERLFHAELMLRLVGCWFFRPRGKSRYF